MNSWLSILSSVLAILAIIFLWLAIYIFRDVILIAEKLEKKDLGSLGILLALPLSLALPVITSYYVMNVGSVPPPEVGIIGSSLFLLAALLLFRPTLALARICGNVHVPGLMLLSYLLTYIVANVAQMARFPALYAADQLMSLAAQLIIGIGLINLSVYTHNFKNFTVQIMNTKFSTHYELSSLLLMAGIILPMGTTLMTTATRDVLVMGAAEAAPTIIPLYFLAHLMLAIGGMLAFVAMLVFKKAIEEFCIRFGSLSALIRKEK
ncbi:MAG: hypothetical protein Q7T16_01640 [Candidatus Burarchaeum sp.]|nr:hypothetical protein [Candidatus Burarchaeum sp.]MDO8339338.1 hypothetical protein [Candidatus Burarchaeum sp.]